MSTIQCKMCGGVLNVNTEVVAACPHCGTVQTLPQLTNPLRTQLVDQINHLRQNKQFNQAEAMCQQLDRNDAEAHWLVALCRYGVVYSKDENQKFVPSVHRSQEASFLEDTNYRAALQCADPAQQPVYIHQAQLIAEQTHKRRENALLRSRNNWKRYCTAAIAMAVLFAGGLGYAIWDCALRPRNEYNDAVALMKEGKYEKAITVFRSIYNYGNIDDQVETCTQMLNEERYIAAQKRLDAGDIVGAYEMWMSLDGYKDSPRKAAAIYDDYQALKLQETKVGDIIYFGSYQQGTPPAEKEVLQWVVLDIQDGKALVTTRYAVSAKPYHQNYNANTWETCTLRSWLNQDFLNAAFTEEEQTRISTVTVPATAEGKADTQDRLFLLSADEVQKYFSEEGSSVCPPTATAKAAGSYVYEDSGNCWWWLRDQGSEKNSAIFVDGKGEIRTKGNRCDYGSGSVRPALWVTLEQS